MRLFPCLMFGPVFIGICLQDSHLLPLEENFSRGIMVKIAVLHLILHCDLDAKMSALHP